ncbi:MAG: hypothetical protein ACP5E3_16885, partial [Bacteroidales bacterium]
IQDSEKQIEVYEKDIAELKLKIAEEKKEVKIKNEERLAKLEMKNNELKNKVVSDKNKQVDNWEERQREFKKDLDTLGNAIADFFVSD